MLIALMYLTEDYRRDPVSMKDQDSPWIIGACSTPGCFSTVQFKLSVPYGASAELDYGGPRVAPP
jgi:hypothetical protein